MSWSFSAVGKPGAICDALDRESSRLSGDSKTEFDAARPALQTLVAANNMRRSLCLKAHGHGAPGQSCATCNVTLESAPDVVI